MQAPSNLKFRLAGSGGDSRTGPGHHPEIPKTPGYSQALIGNPGTRLNISTLLEPARNSTFIFTTCWALVMGWSQNEKQGRLCDL